VLFPQSGNLIVIDILKEIHEKLKTAGEKSSSSVADPLDLNSLFDQWQQIIEDLSNACQESEKSFWNFFFNSKPYQYSAMQITLAL